MLHLTPSSAADFAAGADVGTFWARLADVADLTVSQYKTQVVGVAAAGSTEGANLFVCANPASNVFTRAGTSWAGFPEYINTRILAPTGFRSVP
jgi:hypothetical protein